VKKTPWKGIFIGSMVLVLLVLARCIATVARELYYGRDQWMDLILQDTWFYVGIAAVVVLYISAIVCIVRTRKT
jgi:uncharacterized membrane protein